MNAEASENNSSLWLSTYSLITAKRILERYGITLNNEDLIPALKTPDSFYNHLLRVPLQNVFNGIIFQQVDEYQVYIQKMFVDYLVSGEGSKDKALPGANLREDIEEARLSLVIFNDGFQELELEQDKLIAKCQNTLVKNTKDWQIKIQNLGKELKINLTNFEISVSTEKIRKGMALLLLHANLKSEKVQLKPAEWDRIEKAMETQLHVEARQLLTEKIKQLGENYLMKQESLNDFYHQARGIEKRLMEYRNQFHDLILKVSTLINTLPDYKINSAQVRENKEMLHFDKDLGTKP
jgi:hypothetical protein